MSDRLIRYGRYSAAAAMMTILFIQFMTDIGGSDLVPYLFLLSAFLLSLHGLSIMKEDKKGKIEGYLFLTISSLVFIAVLFRMIANT